MRFANHIRRAGLLALALLLAIGALAQNKFTIAVLPDVQGETNDQRLTQRFEWLAQNQADLNLRMVLQVGDLMNFNDERQYVHQSKAYEVLDRAVIPFANALGNHDTAAVLHDGGSAAPGNVNLNLRNTEKFNRNWPISRFVNYVGSYEPGKIENSYHLFRAGGLKWGVLALELWPRTAVIEWAKQVVDQHPDVNWIVLTHSYLEGNSQLVQNNGGYGDNSPQFLFDQLIKPSANIQMVFSGHTGRHGYLEQTTDPGTKVHAFLQCYHDNETNPTRLVTIDTEARTLETWVYAPNTDERRDDGSARTVNGLNLVKPAD